MHAEEQAQSRCAIWGKIAGNVWKSGIKKAGQARF